MGKTQDDDSKSLADKILEHGGHIQRSVASTTNQEFKSKSGKAKPEVRRLDDFSDMEIITPQPNYVKIEPSSPFDNANVKLVASDISNRF